MVTAYLKQQCGWSRGVREVLAKYGVEYEEKQIHIPENYIEMVEKTQQTNQPCVQLNENIMLVDISGEELASYFDENGFEQITEGDSSVPLDSSCTDEEHEEMKRAADKSQPRIPIRDTGFYGAR